MSASLLQGTAGSSSILGSYSATNDEIDTLLKADPRLKAMGDSLDKERRTNLKLSDDNSTVQKNLKMVHKLLVNEREALQRILEAARQSIRDAKKKQSAAETELGNVRFTLSCERENWSLREAELMARIQELETENTAVRRRASTYAEKLLRHKGRLVLNMLRSGTISALTQFFHVWKDYVQDLQTLQAAQELHEMTQGVGGRSSESPGDYSEDNMQAEFSDLGVEAWDIKDIAKAQFGLDM